MRFPLSNSAASQLLGTQEQSPLGAPRVPDELSPATLLLIAGTYVRDRRHRRPRWRSLERFSHSPLIVYSSARKTRRATAAPPTGAQLRTSASATGLRWEWDRAMPQEELMRTTHSWPIQSFRGRSAPLKNYRHGNYSQRNEELIGESVVSSSWFIYVGVEDFWKRKKKKAELLYTTYIV